MVIPELQEQGYDVFRVALALEVSDTAPENDVKKAAEAAEAGGTEPEPEPEPLKSMSWKEKQDAKTRAQEQLVSVIRAGRDVCRAVIASKVAESPLANCCGPVILVSKSATIFRRVAAEN
jgi:hypothetical protein